MQFWYDLLTSPIVVIAALIIGSLGEVTKRLVNAKAGDKGWKGVFYVTLPAHPVVVGVLVGLIPWLPAHEALTKEGFELAGRIGTYALAGIVCKVGYDTMISTVQRAIKSRAEAAGGSAGGDPPSHPSSSSG